MFDLLLEIEAFFKNYDFEKSECKHININKCAKVIDLKKFVESNIELIKNNKEKLAMPYYERLVSVYLMIKNNNYE